MASALLERFGLARAAGLTFEGARDLYKALGYKSTLTCGDFRARYLRNAVAARVVEAYPKATWRIGGELVEDEDPEVVTDFEDAWDLLSYRVHSWPTFQRVDTLAGLGQYAVLLIGAPGALNSELPKMTSQEEVAFLATYAQEDAEILSYIDDTKDSRFGQPKEYRLRLNRSTTNPILGTAAPILAAAERAVHWSRVIHVADGLLDDTVLGQPRLERVWNLLDDLEKMTGGGSEAFWLRAHQGYVAKIDGDTKIDDEELRGMKEHVEEFAHQIRRTIGLRGTDFKALGSDVANFDRNVDAIMKQISSGSEIPLRILTGSEMGELASTQDRASWDQRVSDRRASYGETMIVRPLVDRLIAYGALPQPVEYAVRWPEISNLTDEQRANVAEKWAGLNEKAGATVVTSAEIRDHVLLLPPLDEVTAEEELPVIEEEEPGPEVVVETETEATVPVAARRLQLATRRVSAKKKLLAATAQSIGPPISARTTSDGSFGRRSKAGP